jgi:hypothetical protein
MLLESDILFYLVADAGFFVAKVDGVEGRNPRKYARRVYVFMPSSGNRAGFLSVIPLLVDIIFVRHTSWEQKSVPLYLGVSPNCCPESVTTSHRFSQFRWIMSMYGPRPQSMLLNHSKSSKSLNEKKSVKVS